MADDEVISVDTSGFQSALERFAAESGKDWATVLRTQSGLLAQRLVQFTPPQGGKSQGMNAVRRDIYRVFKTPAMMYEALNTIKGPEVAKAFWAKIEKKDYAGAEVIVRQNIGAWSGRIRWLDAPVKQIHKSMRDSRGRVRSDKAGFIVTKASALKKYITETQTHVGTARAPFALIARQFGRKLPAWTTNHDVPYEIYDQAEAQGDVKYITFINSLPWISDVQGAEPNYQNAINARERDIHQALDLAADRRAKKV